MALPPEGSDPSPDAVNVDDDGDVFSERLRVIAAQFLAILPGDSPVASPNQDA